MLVEVPVSQPATGDDCPICLGSRPDWRLCPKCGRALNPDVWPCANGSAGRWVPSEKCTIGKSVEFDLNPDDMRGSVVYSNLTIIAAVGQGELVGFNVGTRPMEKSRAWLPELQPEEVCIAYPWVCVLSEKGLFYTEVDAWQSADSYRRVSTTTGRIIGHATGGKEVVWASENGEHFFLNRWVAGAAVSRGHKLLNISSLRSPALDVCTGDIWVSGKNDKAEWVLIRVTNDGMYDVWPIGSAEGVADMTGPLLRDGRVWMLVQTSSGLAASVWAAGETRTLSAVPEDLATPGPLPWLGPPQVRFNGQTLGVGAVLRRQAAYQDGWAFIHYHPRRPGA